MRDEANEQRLISGIECSSDTALEEFCYPKQKYGKEDSRSYYHIMQSFSLHDNNLITVLYCKLSQEDERLGKSLSIENQKILLQKYADNHDFRNCRFYVDEGCRGIDFKRPAPIQMMKDAETGKIAS